MTLGVISSYKVQKITGKKEETIQFASILNQKLIQNNINSNILIQIILISLSDSSHE